MWYALNRLLLGLGCRLLFHYDIEGAHHEPSPPYLIIANHASSIDIPLVGLAVRSRARFMGKVELASSPWMRRWIRSLGGFFVRRGEPDRGAVATAMALLASGGVVCLFPEGTRSADGRMMTLKTGAAYLALKAGVPVLPVAIIGAHRVLPKGASWPRRGRVTIRIGPPLGISRVEGPVTHELLQSWTARFGRALMDLLPDDQHPFGGSFPIRVPVAGKNSEAVLLPRGEALDRLDGAKVDVLIVGGGITGAAIAYVASSSGMRVAVIDQGDFASGTSSRSSRLIHGGMRYLAHGQVRIVWDSLREQGRLAQDAPHLVQPLPILLPLYERSPVAPALVRLGWSLYHALRPAGVQTLRAVLDPEETLRREPLLTDTGLRGTLLYQEFVTHDARLVLETLIGAAQRGALAANYLRLDECLSSGGRIRGAELTDQITGRRLRINARVVVNATGPWSDQIRATAGITAPRLRLSKGVHVLISHRRLPITHGFNLFSPSDGRPIAVVPFDEFVQVGPTETPFAGDPGSVAAGPEDVGYLLEVLRAHFPGSRLTHADVIGTRAGLRPLVDQPGRSDGEVSRAYRIAWDRDGLLSVLGGKLTLHRLAATEALRALATAIPGLPAKAAPVENAWRLPGALIDRDAAVGALMVSGFSEAAAFQLIKTFGRRSLLMRAPLFSHPEWKVPLAPGLPDPLAQAHFCYANEMAVTPDDFLLRRTDVALRVCAADIQLSPAVREIWHAKAAVPFIPAVAGRRSDGAEEEI